MQNLSLSLSHSLSHSPAFPSPFSSSLISSLTYLPSFSFFPPPSCCLYLNLSLTLPLCPPLSPPSPSIFIPPFSLIFPLPSSLLLPPSLVPLFLSSELFSPCCPLLTSAALLFNQHHVNLMDQIQSFYATRISVQAPTHITYIHAHSLSFLLRLINKTLIMRFVGLRLNTRRGLSLTILMCTNMPAAETKE